MTSDVVAAFRFGQLEQWSAIQENRRAIWERYDLELAGWTAHNSIRRPTVPKHCEKPWLLYYLLITTTEARQAADCLEMLDERAFL